MSSLDLVVKQGEARPFEALVRSPSGTVRDLTSAVCFLGIKEGPGDSTYVIAKHDGEFDKSLGAQGIVSVMLNSPDTFIDPGRYCVELKVIMPDGQIVRSLKDYYLVVKKSTIHLNIKPAAVIAAAGGSASGALSDV